MALNARVFRFVLLPRLILYELHELYKEMTCDLARCNTIRDSINRKTVRVPRSLFVIYKNV